MDALNQQVELYQSLRPDLLVVKVVGYSWYLDDATGGPTDESPPKLLMPETELIEIDEYLGLYLPSERKIKVFRENVRRAAEMLGCQERDLEYVVWYHEQAHAILHLGVPQDDRLRSLRDLDYKTHRLQELTETFDAVEPTLHEHLAQLVTYHAIRGLGAQESSDLIKDTAERMLHAFKKLLPRQPPPYRVEPYLNASLERVRGTIHLIKNRWLIGKLEPWKQIMQWE